MRFAYARRGGPLLDWNGVTPPYPSRAGETRSLGDWYPTVRTSNALRRYGGRVIDRGDAIGYEHNRSLGVGDWYPTTRTSSAVRRYENNRALGGGSGFQGAGYHPPPGMSGYNLPRPGSPEVVEGYEPPNPGAAVIHLGGRMMSDYPWDQRYPGQTNLGGYMPEGAARTYGQTMLSEDAPAPPKQFDMGLIRKAGILAAAYHGVKRNNGSILGGLLWAASAWAVFPFYGTIVPAIAVAQGFAQPKGPRQNPAQRRRRKSRRRLRRYRRR